MPVPVSELYSELMHYTTFEGLKGVISSGCLWATDAKYLNDASEITHFFDVRLIKVITGTVRARCVELAQLPDNLAKMMLDGGVDAVVDKQTNELVNTLKDATISMNRPFVLSLCGTCDSRIAQSGLLSQWRSYGTDRGYAIVFDTVGIEQALHFEASKHHYMHVQIGDVYYEGVSSALQPAAPDFDEFEKTVRIWVDRILRGGTADETENFYQAMTSLSCLCKHWGFWEEREVRIVVVPASQNVFDADPDSGRPPKTIKSRKKGNVQVPYLELFSNEQPRPKTFMLPIKRIIVGPHCDSSKRVKAAEALLSEYGYRVTVQESEIPYLG